MKLSYRFNKTEKRLLLQVSSDPAVVEMLKLPGKSIFWPEEALELSRRVKLVWPMLSARIAAHPGLVGQQPADAPMGAKRLE